MAAASTSHFLYAYLSKIQRTPLDWKKDSKSKCRLQIMPVALEIRQLCLLYGPIIMPIMGAMAAGLAAMGAIIMPPIIIGAGAGAAPPFRDSLLGSSTVSTTCTIACRGHRSLQHTGHTMHCWAGTILCTARKGLAGATGATGASLSRGPLHRMSRLYPRIPDSHTCNTSMNSGLNSSAASSTWLKPPLLHEHLLAHSVPASDSPMTLAVGHTSLVGLRARKRHLVSPDVRLRHIGRCLHAADDDAAGALQVHRQRLAGQHCCERLVVSQALGLQMAGHPVREQVSQQC